MRMIADRDGMGMIPDCHRMGMIPDCDGMRVIRDMYFVCMIRDIYIVVVVRDIYGMGMIRDAVFVRVSIFKRVVMRIVCRYPFINCTCFRRILPSRARVVCRIVP